MAELLSGGAAVGPSPSTPTRTIPMSPAAGRWRRGSTGRVRGPHADLHRRGQGDVRPVDRPGRSGGDPDGRGRRGGGGARPGRSGASWASPTASSTTTDLSGRRWWPRCGGSVRTPCSVRTRRPSSSARTTSTTGTTGSPGSPSSTRWRRRRPCRTTSPRPGPAHQVTTVLLSGTLEPDVWVDITATVDAKGEAVGCHRSQFPDGGSGRPPPMRLAAEDAGRQAGVPCAEGFRRLRLGG